MDVGPDGSLCRLTSSFSKGVCNVKIVKVSEEDLKSTDYKLVLIDEKTSDCDSAFEKSDEEPFSLESLDIELGIAKSEKAEDKTEEVAPEKPPNKNTGNKPFNRHFRPNNMNRKRNNYVSPGQRNFKPYNNGNKSYNRQTVNQDNNVINPWLDPPSILTTMDSYQYGNYPQYVTVGIDPSMNTPVSSNIDPIKSIGRGLLGNSPFDQNRAWHNFQNNNVNHFPHNSNYWNGEFSNNYQHRIQNRPMSGKPPYKKHHTGKFWKNRPNSFNRNRNKNQERRGRGRRFNYRQQ